MSSDSHNYQVWFEKAENDLLNISNNLSAKNIPWDTVCFHAQQAAEKYLKGFLIFHGNTPPRTHDLIAILGNCIDYDDTLSNIKEDCFLLSEMAVASRYPSDIYEPAESDGKKMIRSANNIKQEITSRVA
jgi:HEPN domain-containing protein